MNQNTAEARPQVNMHLLPFPYDLDLMLTDQELVQEILAIHEGSERDDYVRNALKIGILALKQARGQIDGDTVKREGQQLLATLEGKLNLHATSLDAQVTRVLKE